MELWIGEEGGVWDTNGEGVGNGEGEFSDSVPIGGEGVWGLY